MALARSQPANRGVTQPELNAPPTQTTATNFLSYH